MDALNDRVKRCGNIKEIIIKIGNRDATYTREQIISDDFKIRQEDFR